MTHGTHSGYCHGCRCEECRAAHREYDREVSRRWRARHPEVVCERSRRSRAKRPEVARERVRRWKAEHPGYRAKWDQEHPEAVREHARAHEAGMGVAEYREFVRMTLPGYCRLCLDPLTKAQFDHDHRHDPQHPKGVERCRECFRGWLCGSCNCRVAVYEASVEDHRFDDEYSDVRRYLDHRFDPIGEEAA